MYFVDFFNIFDKRHKKKLLHLTDYQGINPLTNKGALC